ncbi:MAG TPA: hypothetical protein VK501_24565 [Baekduia sp.]|uniref:hypothetical protein n=1 Tax=Baekduia sp. TaxID=2600305 RepID=UPI002C134ED7|nr:hypothetical protein [Baekduia sp.]HMJ37101.1 hypothetical protein [Baekduia sp.]
MAIGRFVHEAVRSERDNKWWSYIQLFPVRHPLTYDNARRRPALKDWKKLSQMAGRLAAITPPDAAAHLLREVTRRDPQARTRLTAWRSPLARLPRVDDRDLHDAWFEPSPPPMRLPDEHERFLADEISETLVRRRKARPRIESDGLTIGTGATVHLMTREGASRFPDVVLVDRTRSLTLLLIEVKLHARLGDLRGLRDVVDQVLEYKQLLRERDRDWKVRPVIVAERVSENVVDRATEMGVEVWRFDRSTRRFKALAGSYG